MVGDEWRNASVEERLEYSLVKVIKFKMSTGLDQCTYVAPVFMSTTVTS